MLKPNCVLNLVALPCLQENNLTNKLFLLLKTFNPGFGFISEIMYDKEAGVF